MKKRLKTLVKNFFLCSRSMTILCEKLIISYPNFLKKNFNIKVQLIFFLFNIYKTTKICKNLMEPHFVFILDKKHLKRLILLCRYKIKKKKSYVTLISYVYFAGFIL